MASCIGCEPTPLRGVQDVTDVVTGRGVHGLGYDGFDLAHTRPYILTGLVLQALTRS